MEKLRAGILGATGMVGQKLVKHLAEHPWFEIVRVAAGKNSAGKYYYEALMDRGVKTDWLSSSGVREMVVMNAVESKRLIAQEVDLVFCAVDMDKAETAQLEEDYARLEVPVVSTTSAHRWTPDIPMIIPEVNPEHLDIIPAQRKRLGTKCGCIVVKPNCSVQSYVPPIHALRELMPTRVSVCTYQALSGAGKTLKAWPEMEDNIIPFIPGEEEKSECEPGKIWGIIRQDRILASAQTSISAQCVRVPVSDGHLAAVSVVLAKPPTREQILEYWTNFRPKPQTLNLPSAPQPCLRYFSADDRPQTRLDRDAGDGMAITLGRLRRDLAMGYLSDNGWKFIALSHNLIRGAAGGAILTAELMKAEGWLNPQ